MLEYFTKWQAATFENYLDRYFFTLHLSQTKLIRYLILRHYYVIIKLL